MPLQTNKLYPHSRRYILFDPYIRARNQISLSIIPFKKGYSYNFFIHPLFSSNLLYLKEPVFGVFS